MQTSPGIKRFFQKHQLLRELVLNILLSRIRMWFRFYGWMSDKRYICMRYRQMFGVNPNLDNPRNFNEKNNWRKLHDRKPEYTDMVDKYRFKSIAASRVGEGHTFPLYGVWKDPREIDFDRLPDSFVLKVNHAGGIIACRNKADFDTRSAIRELRRALKTNFFIRSREWPYKNVRRMVIAEKYMGENLTDYKNYCFGGKLQYTFVWRNISREDGRKPQAYFCGAYDREWRKTSLDIDYPKMDIVIEKPQEYEQMIHVAEALSRDIPFVRVDCYIVDGVVYAGEMTFFPWGGFQKFKSEEWNLRLGEMQHLPAATNK